MKCSISTVILGACLLSAGTYAATSPGEEDILHAAFVAFQEPGIFTAKEIRNSRDMLVQAARGGNKIARLVISRQEDPDSFSILAGMTPHSQSPTLD